MLKKVLVSLLSLSLIVGGTYLAIKFAQGYRPNLENRTISGTGLLVANSFPDGAQVFINSKLTTATDDTLNLPPGTYEIEIKKDGFTSWQKTLILQNELVTQTNATLFSSVPTLKPLTFTGANALTPSPDGQKIAYLVQGQIWVIDLNGNTFVRSKEPRQISSSLGDEPIYLTWSPDSRQILASTSDANYLLDASNLNNDTSLRDVTARLPLIFSEWEAILARKELESLLTLPEIIQKIMMANATNLYFSPDGEKILYTATSDTTIPENIIPDLPSESTQPESRTLEAGNLYVYDLKEDKNFLISPPPPAELGLNLLQKIRLVDEITPKSSLFQTQDNSATSASNTTDVVHDLLQAKTTTQTIANFNAIYSPLPISSLQWFPTSTHLVSTQPDQINIIEADGTNSAVVYANKFEENFVYPWPDGSQLIILTNLNQSSNLPANLYSINLK